MESKEERNYLYIFFHVPRTAGTAMRFCLENDLKKEELLFVYNRKRSNNLLHHDLEEWSYVNLLEVDDHLASLQDSQKDKIKIMYGHAVCQRLCKYFNREPRYIAFFRHPVDRTISHYNYSREVYENTNHLCMPPVIGAEGGVMTFEEWFKNKVLHNFMTRYIVWVFSRKRKFEDDLNKEDLEAAKKILSRFCFIGITENFHKDALFICNMLGIKGVCGRENFSKKHFVLYDNEEIRELIRSRNQLDFALYEYAKDLNKKFRSGKKDMLRKGL